MAAACPPRPGDHGTHASVVHPVCCSCLTWRALSSGPSGPSGAGTGLGPALLGGFLLGVDTSRAFTRPTRLGVPVFLCGNLAVPWNPRVCCGTRRRSCRLWLRHCCLLHRAIHTTRRKLLVRLMIPRLLAAPTASHLLYGRPVALHHRLLNNTVHYSTLERTAPDDATSAPLDTRRRFSRRAELAFPHTGA